MPNQIDKSEVIAELQRVAKILNTKHLGKNDYKKVGKIRQTTIINRFGSWNKALEAAGLSPALPKKRNPLNDDDLLIDIISVTRKLKKIPSASEMIAHGKYSQKPYVNRWGSFPRARDTAYQKYGFPPEIDTTNATSTNNTSVKPSNSTSTLRSSKSLPSESANSLKPHLLKIKNIDTRNFVEEAINCFEAGLYRSAVVMSWVGAVSLLYDHVLAHRLADFNAEARRRDPKWKNATTKDDLALMKESEFLDILAALSIIGKNVKEQLKSHCLSLRNACGHPNSFKVGRKMAEAHLETLLLNVYEVF